MTSNEICTGTLNIIGRTQSCSGIQWLTEIICHLRDDLAIDDPRRQLPPDGDICGWVKESFYPGLLDLTWEEAVLSLLSRMRRRSAGWPSSKINFASIALAQLRKATQNSQLWRV